jgi:hypothetical protein
MITSTARARDRAPPTTVKGRVIGRKPSAGGPHGHRLRPDPQAAEIGGRNDQTGDYTIVALEKDGLSCS